MRADEPISFGSLSQTQYGELASQDIITVLQNVSEGRKSFEPLPVMEQTHL